MAKESLKAREVKRAKLVKGMLRKEPVLRLKEITSD